MNHSALRLSLLSVFLSIAACASNGRAREAEGVPGVHDRLPAGDWLLESRQMVTNVAERENGIIDMENGLVRRSFCLKPEFATIALDQMSTGASLLRSVGPDAEITIDNNNYKIGGLTGQPIHNYIDSAWIASMRPVSGSFHYVRHEIRPLSKRLEWRPNSAWIAKGAAWPPPGRELRVVFQGPEAIRDVEVVITYEMYDQLPLVGKVMEVVNHGQRSIKINTFKLETLAFVEASSDVEPAPRYALPNVHVEADLTKAAMTGEAASAETVTWVTDPEYKTQVNYRLETPCRLEVRPPLGPSVELGAGERFQTFHSWILAFDSRDETRRTLALCRMYRAISPWVAENPLIFHVRTADDASVRSAIDQAASTGFELVIMTFGSGFDIEDTSANNLNKYRDLAAYARSKGIALGGYSLLASRSVGAADDVINPATGKPGGFARFGESPCLGSRFGLDYFNKLRKFYEYTGCMVLEHDGSYPGDACASTVHPGHRNYEDSYWSQWRMITEFYQWCRARGIYLNVPDWYFMNGSNKTGMGYRETNWSLPREYQEVIERQNIHDGTRYKTPTMGWMFVPLVEYQGGGAAATIEPLSEHLDHYERRLANLLGAGVQACFRGPRLYDTEKTREMVSRQVRFYKDNRAILDSDIIVLRRPDGRDWDGILHVHPGLDVPAIAMIYNPLDQPVSRTIQIPLYYSGLSGRVVCKVGDAHGQSLQLPHDCRATIFLSLPARGWVSVAFSAP